MSSTSEGAKTYQNVKIAKRENDTYKIEVLHNENAMNCNQDGEKMYPMHQIALISLLGELNKLSNCSDIF